MSIHSQLEFGLDGYLIFIQEKVFGHNAWMINFFINTCFVRLDLAEQFGTFDLYWLLVWCQLNAHILISLSVFALSHDIYFCLCEHPSYFFLVLVSYFYKTLMLRGLMLSRGPSPALTRLIQLVKDKQGIALERQLWYSTCCIPTLNPQFPPYLN